MSTVANSSPYRSVLNYHNIKDLTKVLQTASLDNDVKKDAEDWRLTVVDSDASADQNPEHEAKRLQALKDLQILDSGREDVFDQLTAEVREHMNVSLAVICFVDLGRVWIKSMDGEKLDITEASRREAFCAHTILVKKGLLVVPDATEDVRFRNTPSVSGAPGFRFYAGAPLVTPGGYKIGSLCVMDKKPRPQGLGKKEEEFLRAKAQATVRALITRKNQIQCDGDSKRGRSMSDLFSVSPTIKRVCSNHALDAYSLPDILKPPFMQRAIPDPKTSDLDPDQYLNELLESLHGVAPKITPALKLEGFFVEISEDQVAAYSMDVVCAARENNSEKLRSFLKERGRECLDCYNRFGEGLLNLACRRGFKDMVKFLLSSEVKLNVRVRDDYGRTPLHDACWNPEPQLDIVSWILQEDPTLFLIADKRGFTPFQYARQSDWQIWRQFLFDNKEQFEALMQPEILEKFS